MPDSSAGKAFCIFGLLRARGALERIVSVLPEARRDSVVWLMESYSAVPEPELRRSLAEHRHAESEDFRSRLKLPPGADPDRVSPPVRRWLESKVGIGDGRKDHQSQSGR